MSRVPAGIAKFDSATAMVQALGRFLHGRDFPALGQSRFLEFFVQFADRVPRATRERIFASLGASEGVAPEAAGAVSAEEIAEWMAGLYPQRRYPAVMIGSSSGALVHIGAAFGIPWLPQTFLTLIRESRVHPDNPKHAMEAGREAACRFLSANPNVQLHHLHDPSQDRLMLRLITYFRAKFLRLPPAYRTFLERSLTPGGTIVVVECQRPWPTTRVGDRHVFQFGAVGGPTIEEYFYGGERVADYLARYDSPMRLWEPPKPDAERPEAEWGFEPALRADIERFAHERGYRIERLIFDEAEHLSPQVADLYRKWYRERGISANRLVIESFVLLEPYWTLRTGSVPFWMTFNMQPSLDWVQRYLGNVEPYDFVHLMLFAHGVNSVGLPEIDAWRALLRAGRRGGSLLGIDADAYPAHFGTFAKYYRDLRRLPERYPLPEPLSFERFTELNEQAATARRTCAPT